MKYIVAAFICLALYIIKDGPPGPVCFILFIGYCVWDIAKQREKNIKIREAREENHLLTKEQVDKHKEALSQEKKDLENRGISLGECHENIRFFDQRMRSALAENKVLIEELAKAEGTEETELVNERISESNNKIDKLIHDADFSVGILENSKAYGNGCMESDAFGTLRRVPGTWFRVSFDFVLKDKAYLSYLESRKEWEKKYGR